MADSRAPTLGTVSGPSIGKIMSCSGVKVLPDRSDTELALMVDMAGEVSREYKSDAGPHGLGKSILWAIDAWNRTLG